MAPANPERRLWWLCSLAVVLLLPFLSILRAPNGRILGHELCDSATAYYHFAYFLGACLRDGIVPLWNPHIMLGIPFVGEGQGSVFHPLSLSFTFFNASVAVNWLVVSSFVLTGLFFFGYLRALGLGHPAAWCGAMTWSFSSAMISRIYAGHLNILLTFVSIPLLMMFWERFRSRGDIRQLVGVAVAYGLMILAFYPQVLYMFSLFLLLYVLIQSVVSIIERSSTPRREFYRIVKLGVAIVLGVGVGAIQLLPSVDFVLRSFRQESTIEFCSMFSFPPENLLTLVAPQFFGTGLFDGPSRYWGRNLFWEMWMYIGVLPLLLAAAGVFVAPKGRRIPLLCCAAIFLIFGFGKNTPLYPLLYDHFPLFDVFRGSSKNTLVTLFCLVVLSAYGFEGLFGQTEESRRRQLRRIAAGTGVVLLFLSLGAMTVLVHDAATPDSNWKRLLLWLHEKPAEMYHSSDLVNTREFIARTSGLARAALMRAVVLIALSLVAVLVIMPTKWRGYAFVPPLVLIAIDLLAVFVPLVRTFDHKLVQAPLVLDASAQTVYPPRILVPLNPIPNRAMRGGYSSPFGYTGNTLVRYNDLISRVQFLSPRESRAESKFIRYTQYFSMLGLDAVALDPVHVPPHADQIGKLGDKVLIRYDVTNAVPERAFLAAAPRYFSRREDALAYVFSNQDHVVTSPAIERSKPALPAHPLEQDESIKFISFSPNRVELDVQCKWPRELVLCSMFERNWVAEVNGTASPIEPANYVFRAVQVPAGASRVVFEYRPKAFYWGAAITLASIGLLGGIVIGTSCRKTRKLRCADALACAAPVPETQCAVGRLQA